MAINLKITYRISDLYTYLTRYSSPEDVLNAKGYEVVMGRPSIRTSTPSSVRTAASCLTASRSSSRNMPEAELGLEVMSVTLASIHRRWPSRISTRAW